MASDLDPADRATIARQLGRPPRGLQAVETRCPSGHPEVIRVYPLVEGQPFPTLFWLSCPELVRQISALEHQGLIHAWEAELARDARLRARYVVHHRAYLLERWRRLTPRDRAWVREQGMLEAFTRRGVAGVANWLTVKCLHAQYAHHRARRNLLGQRLEAEQGLRRCPAPPSQGEASVST